MNHSYTQLEHQTLGMDLSFIQFRKSRYDLNEKQIGTEKLQIKWAM